MAAMSAALVLLSACGEFENTPFEEGGVVGRVLRGDKTTGRVVVMGADPKDTDLDDEGRFHFDSLKAGPQELMVVASATEALRVPALVAGAQVTDLEDLDPVAAAFIVVNATNTQMVASCWMTIHQTDLRQIRDDGYYRFVAGPLAPGCYDATMDTEDAELWRQHVCLQPGERRAFDATW